MRHGKHRFLLGCTKEHREALMANLASALLRHGKIETTLAKAKALRPFVEKIITMAKKAYLAEDSAQKLHYRRLAITRVKDEDAVAILFNDRASEFVKRNGGYSRIYKLMPRTGDAAKIAIIELVLGDDVGYTKSKKRNTAKTKKSTPSKKSKQEQKIVSDVIEEETTTTPDKSVPKATTTKKKTTKKK
jgi:large subunit ribosomal protein L17